MLKKTVGVIAGTPVDTQMGVSVAENAGFSCVSRYLSNTPAEQSILQVLHKERLMELVFEACFEMTKEGAEGIFMYCNSLAGAVDMALIRSKLPVDIVTPLDVYRNLALKHKKVAVMAANCQALAAIEHVFSDSNPDCTVYGSGTLQIVEAIEAEVDPKEIMDALGVSDLVRSFCKMGGEILVLGCTHFPYFKEHVELVSTIPVVDPAQAMLSMINQDTR